MPGTVEGLVLGLARALEPVEQRLQTPQGAVLLFEELGLPLPGPVQAAIQAAPQVPQAAAAIAALLPHVPTLAAAIAARDSAAIATAVGAIAGLAQTAFTRLRELAVTAKAAYPTDLSGFSADVRVLIEALPERLVEYLLVGSLEAELPVPARIVALLGLTENTPVPATADHPAGTRRRLRTDRIGTFLNDPAQVLADAYGWGPGASTFAADVLFGRLERLLDAVGMPAAVDPTTPALSATFFRLQPRLAAGVPAVPPVLDLVLGLTALTDVELPLSEPTDAWDVRLVGSGTLELGDGLELRPPLEVTAGSPTGAVSGELALAFSRTATGVQPMLLFGRLDGTRLTARAVAIRFGGAFSAGPGGPRADLAFSAAVDQGALVVSLAGADGFLASMLPAGLTLSADAAALWDATHGLTFRGGAGLAFTIPLQTTLGPARLDRLDLAVGVVSGAAPAVAIEARLTGALALGPFSASVEGVGAGADLLLRGGGSGPAPAAALDLGPVAVGFRFLAPRGLGLAVDAGPIRGGGFILLDEPAGRYAGVLQLSLGPVGVTAIGLLDTRLPGGAQGFALLVVLKAEFPPIQLGFGFALSSVGGLLALNRRVDVDALRQRMASGTVGRILNPEDPIRNAPVLLADLGAVFPPAPGVVVVGPTLALSWAEIVRLDLGVFVELPGPTKVVLLGSARAGIPNPSGGRPYLQLRMDIVGQLDFAREVMEFDAVLVDSHILELLELTGGASFRLSWGAEPYVVLSVGGFHPAYSPAPLIFPPSLTRVAMTREMPFLSLRFEGYFAVTTNTLQFGAAVEVIVSAGGFNVRGFLGFDALIRFQPFSFVFTFVATVEVRYRGRRLAGLQLRGELSGPGPIVFHGKVCIEILFFDICWEETFTLGSSSPPAVSPVSSAVAELALELEDPANLRALDASDPSVSVEPARQPGLTTVSPLGQLVWTQERAPLDLLLQRFEGAPLQTVETVTATGGQVTGSEDDWFAPGSFAELADADALNRRAFERLHAGVRLGAAGSRDGPAPPPTTVTVRQIRLPAAASTPMTLTALPGWLLRAVAGRYGAAERDPVSPAVSVRDESWTVRNATGGVAVDGLSQAQAHQLATVGGAGIAVAAADTAPAFAF